MDSLLAVTDRDNDSITKKTLKFKGIGMATQIITYPSTTFSTQKKPLLRMLRKKFFLREWNTFPYRNSLVCLTSLLANL